MTHSHRAPTGATGPLRRTIERLGPLGVGVVIGAVLFGGGGALGATALAAPGDPVACPGGVDLLVHADKSWSCGVAASPSPTVSASPSPTVNPSASPTASPSPTPSPTATSSVCPVAGANRPGARDPWGGCFPGPGNTGVPVGAVLTAYAGPCTITAAGTVIDSKLVQCATLNIRAANVTIKNSLLQGVDLTNAGVAGSSYTIMDSKVTNGARDQCLCIGGHDYVELRVEVVGGNRSGYCMKSCTVQDSWHHGQQLQGDQHASGQRIEQNAMLRHNTIVCDWAFPGRDGPTQGCSGGVTGYGDFAVIRDNTLTRNLMLGSDTESYCVYGGATNGKPYSNSPGAGTGIKITNNVFQHGVSGKCGHYAPVGDFAPTRAGNEFSGNVWDTGEPVTLSQLG